MQTAPVPNSAGAPQPDNAGPPMGGGNGKGFWAGAPPGKPGGEIVLSRAEAAALTAFETEDPKEAMKQAMKASGLSREQLDRLKARAERARKAGYSLRGGTITLRPLNHPDDPADGGLVPHEKEAKGRKDAATKGAETRSKNKTNAKRRTAYATKKAKPAAKVAKTAESALTPIDLAFEELLREYDPEKPPKKKKKIGSALATAAAKLEQLEKRQGKKRSDLILTHNPIVRVRNPCC